MLIKKGLRDGNALIGSAIGWDCKAELKPARVVRSDFGLNDSNAA